MLWQTFLPLNFSRAEAPFSHRWRLVKACKADDQFSSMRACRPVANRGSVRVRTVKTKCQPMLQCGGHPIANLGCRVGLPCVQG